MASPVHSVSSQQLPIPHMPKLQYRTKSSDSINFAQPDSTSSMSTVSISFSSGVASTAPTSPGPSAHCLSPRTKKEGAKTISPVDSMASSVPQSSRLLHASRKNPKRRGKSFFGFFGVKEPSQQAFEDYQRQLRKKGGTKNGRVNAVGLSGVSSAKLPPTVPKVNSKWDGVPQGVKDKGKQKQIAPPPSSGGYSRSIGTSGSEASMSAVSSTTRSRASSRHSSAAGPQQCSATSLSDLYGWESESRSSGSTPGNAIKAHDKARQSSLASTIRKPHVLGPNPPPLPPSIPEEYLVQSLDTSLRSAQSERCPSPALSTQKSPLDASATASSSKNLPCNQSDRPTKAVIKTTTREIPATDEVILNSNGFRILGPPASARRKSKSPFLAGEAKEMLVPGGETTLDSESKMETIPYRPSPLARLNTSASIAPLEGFTPRTNPTPEGHHASPSALDEGRKLRKKSRLGLFGK